MDLDEFGFVFATAAVRDLWFCGLRIRVLCAGVKAQSPTSRPQLT